MANTVNKIPSINLPFTNEQGVIHPIWYEYLRSFISSVETDVAGISAGETVVAGAGLTKSSSTLNVGAGSGISVDADTVNVDINGQINAQAAVEDEILIVDASDSSQIRKTSLQSVANLSVANPGGDTTQIQYNNVGEFAGDSGFTTDGAGSLTIVGDLTVDNVNINGNTLATNSSSNPFIFTVPAGAAATEFTFAQSGAASSAFGAIFQGLKASSNVTIASDTDATSATSNATLGFATNGTTASWAMGLYDTNNDDFVFANTINLNTGQVFTISGTNRYFTHNTPMNRVVTATITASTTQTQGQGALTSDINEVSTCANVNDTVTLRSAEAGAHQLVIHNGAQTLQIFPASGDDLGAGVNTATTLAAGGKALFVAYDATNWKQLI